MISLIQKHLKTLLSLLLATSVLCASPVFAKAEGEAETRYQGAASGIDPSTTTDMIDSEGPPADNRFGYARSLEHAMACIDEAIDDE